LYWSVFEQEGRLGDICPEGAFGHRGEKERMYRILDGSENGIVGIKVESKLTLEEYELLHSYLKQVRLEVGPINFLCDMADFEGRNSQALWEEMTSHLPGLRDYGRIAVVGDRQWLECGTNVGEPWLETQLKYFLPNQIDEAWNWVKGRDA
jgi:hypothetical protein